MTHQPTRRGAIAVTLTAAALVSSAQAAPAMPTGKGRGDFDFLVGRWNVKHRRLNGRLVGSTDWQVFNGTSELWLTLDGLGTVDDNRLELPGGTYRAMGIRAFDPKTGKWAIWWLDERYPTAIEPPVYGTFKDGVGTFLGDDTLAGKPIVVRFQWSKITPTSARWEQAFSPDGGATWETNWEMDFARA
ncbi:MAG: hypothetical protein JWP35_1519 [Caulobacter sp.]|nr:hypothetical protein [Caulobacter sp.]